LQRIKLQCILDNIKNTKQRSRRRRVTDVDLLATTLAVVVQRAEIEGRQEGGLVAKEFY